MKNRNLILASAGHFVIDSFAGFFPIYIAMRDLNLLKAGAISTAASLVANVLQPVFGFMSDRVSRKLVLCTALILGPVFMSLIGRTGEVWVLGALVVAGQLMVSLFHPAATDMSTAAEGEERSHLRFSVFTTVGTVGFSLSGIIFYRFCIAFGTANSFFLAIPGLFAAALLFLFTTDKKTGHAPPSRSALFRVLRENGGFITVLYTLTVIRAAIQVVIGYALPSLYKEWGYDAKLWAVPNFIFICSGAVSMLLCGMFEKRINPVRLIFYSMILSVPFFLLFLYAGAKGSAFSFLLVGIVGFINAASFPANVVMGQNRMPDFAGTVSGLLMGAGWGLASLAPLFVSAVAALDLFPAHYGKLLPGMAIIGLLPLSGAWISRRLSRQK